MKIFSKQTIFLAILLMGLFFAMTTLAADIEYGPQAPFPGFQGSGENNELTINNSSFGQYIGALYKYGVAFGASLAVIMMMIGGIIWLTSAGSSEKVGQARAYIGGAISGLVLLLCSYLILYTINPELVELKSLNIGPVNRIERGCSWEEKQPRGNKGYVKYEESTNPENCGSKPREKQAGQYKCYCPKYAELSCPSDWKTVTEEEYTKYKEENPDSDVCKRIYRADKIVYCCNEAVICVDQDWPKEHDPAWCSQPDMEKVCKLTTNNKGKQACCCKSGY